MKSIIPIILALICGLFIGAWGPRSELRIAKNNVSDLKKQLLDCGKSSQPMIGEVSKILGVTQQNKSSQASPTLDSDRKHSSKEKFHKEPDMKDSREDENTLESSENLEESLQIATDMWNVRREYAKELLIENLDLTGAEIDDFEKAMAGMNEKLGDQIQSIVDELLQKETLSAEDGLHLANEITGTLLKTYDEMDRIFPEDWRERTTDESGPMNFIDPRVAGPFLELEAEMAREEYDAGA